MSSFTDFERQQIVALRDEQDKDLDCIKCKQCSGQWFEEVQLNRYKADHHVVLGQAVPARPGSVPYIMLKCARCGNLIEPRVIHATRDVGGRDYDHFLDTLDGVGDTRQTKVEEKSDEIQSQKL